VSEVRAAQKRGRHATLSTSFPRKNALVLLVELVGNICQHEQDSNGHKWKNYYTKHERQWSSSSEEILSKLEIPNKLDHGL
jgi:hypothetical protein